MSKKKSNKSDSTSLEQEEVLTAVVLADDFNKRFHPLDITKPKCLLPLANKPLIHYTLQLLVTSQVKKIFIYCAKCYDDVKKYIMNSKWKSQDLCGADVHLVPAQDLSCVGDVFRLIEERNSIPYDFIFLTADVVSNSSLQQAFSEHKERRKKQKDVALLTVVTNEVSPGHSIRVAEDDTHIVHDAITNRIYRFNKLKNNDKYSCSIPMDVLKKTDAKVRLNYSMIDTGIWMCSPKVAQIFADNFDYETQVDFIKGVIDCEEFLGCEIHMHAMKSAYCCRVVNLLQHKIVQQDVINRWLYPIVPEVVDEYQLFNSITSACDGSMKEMISYKVKRNNVYIHNSCDISRHGDIIKCNVMIDSDTKISDGSVIAHTVIGKNCQIGENVDIRGCTLMDNVKIGSGCTIVDSIICSNVEIGCNVIVKHGSILCDAVKICDEMVLKGATLICLYKNKEMFENQKEIDGKKFSFDVVGKEGVGFCCDRNYDDDYESDFSDDESVSSSSDVTKETKMPVNNNEVDDVINKMWGMKLEDVEQEIWNEDDDDDTDDMSDHENNTSLIVDDGESSEISSSDDDDDGLMNSDINQFQKDVIETLERGINDKVQWDNLFLEISGSKSANNISFENMIRTITKCLIIICLQKTDESGSSFNKIYELVIKSSFPLLKHYVKDEACEMLTLEAYEKFAGRNDKILSAFSKILLFLYNEDIISEETIISWNNKKPEDVVRTKVKQVVEWLKNAEEEETSEESDSD